MIKITLPSRKNSQDLCDKVLLKKNSPKFKNKNNNKLKPRSSWIQPWHHQKVSKRWITTKRILLGYNLHIPQITPSNIKIQDNLTTLLKSTRKIKKFWRNSLKGVSYYPILNNSQSEFYERYKSVFIDLTKPLGWSYT